MSGNRGRPPKQPFNRDDMSTWTKKNYQDEVTRLRVANRNLRNENAQLKQLPLPSNLQFRQIKNTYLNRVCNYHNQTKYLEKCLLRVHKDLDVKKLTVKELNEKIGFHLAELEVITEIMKYVDDWRARDAERTQKRHNIQTEIDQREMEKRELRKASTKLARHQELTQDLAHLIEPVYNFGVGESNNADDLIPDIEFNDNEEEKKKELVDYGSDEMVAVDDDDTVEDLSETLERTNLD